MSTSYVVPVPTTNTGTRWCLSLRLIDKEAENEA